MVDGPLEKDTCQDYVLPLLQAAGWSDEQIIEQFPITAGRVVPVGKKHRRAKPLRADYVLEYEPNVPVAVVEAKREYAIPGKGLQQAKNYAQLLDLPLAYSTNGKGIVEDDRDTGLEDDTLVGFPSPDEAWSRFRAWKGIVEDEVAEGLLLPFNRALRNPDGSVKEPRYYQRIAINRAVEAILRGDKRLLLTLATGTGKTFTSMQIVWKLWKSNWRSGRNPRILYLADRNILVDQPIEREYKPAFGSSADTPIWKLQGEAKAGREIYFALYQQLADSGEDLNGMFREFAPDFFDLVIVDECHRGSARAESSWRAILDHFTPATQLGMTATPKRDETVDSYEYFGDPLYEYSLAQGIEDGFLAPYRVRRVVLSPDAHGFAPSEGQLDRYRPDPRRAHGRQRRGEAARRSPPPGADRGLGGSPPGAPRQLVNELWSLLKDPRVSTTGVLLVGLAAGFGLVGLGYQAVARLALVPFQLPYVVSGGVVGLAVVGTALALLDVHIDRVEAAQERRLLAELHREALRLRAERASR